VRKTYFCAGESERLIINKNERVEEFTPRIWQSDKRQRDNKRYLGLIRNAPDGKGIPLNKSENSEEHN